MTKFPPLPIAKRDLPKDPAAASGLTTTIKTIASLSTIRSKSATVEYWEELSAYAARNIAELNGAAKPATAAKGKPARGRRTMAAAAAAD